MLEPSLNEKTPVGVRFVALLVVGFVAFAMTATSFVTAQTTSPSPPDTSSATTGINGVASFMLGILTALVVFLLAKWIIGFFSPGHN
jgi:hypothetical protein